MVKKCTSLTLAFSGIIMLVTSIVLFLGPATWVSHFSPWKFWGLTRHHWGALHLNSGILFCLAMVIHSCIHWKLLITYIKTKKLKYGSASLFISLLLTSYVCIGGNYNLPPMGTLLKIARTSRMASIQKYGSPPYGAASDYPVKRIIRYMGWDLNRSIARLKKNNITVNSPEQSLIELANANHTTIGHLLDIMYTEKTRLSESR